MTTRKVILSVTCICLTALVLPVFSTPAAAQPPEEEMSPETKAMMEAWQKAMTPGPRHELLARSVGTWKMTVKSWMEPGAEPQVSEGTAEREMILGGRYLQEKVHGTMMGMPFEGMGLTGYDNAADKYVGIWADNMSTGIMTMEGHRNADKMVFIGTATDPMDGKPMKMKMVSTPHEGTEVVEFFDLRDGQEVKSMEITYTRQ